MGYFQIYSKKAYHWVQNFWIDIIVRFQLENFLGDKGSGKMSAGKFPPVSMGGPVEGLTCADQGGTLQTSAL